MDDLSPYYDEDDQFLILKNSNHSGEYDRHHPFEQIEDQASRLGDSISTKEVEEVHAIVQEVTNHALHMLPSSARI